VKKNAAMPDVKMKMSQGIFVISICLVLISGLFIGFCNQFALWPSEVATLSAAAPKSSESDSGISMSALQNLGFACPYGNDILISTQNGIVKYSPATRSAEKLTTLPSRYLNSAQGHIYFQQDTFFGQKINIYSNKPSNLKSFLCSSSLQIVGDFAFLFGDEATLIGSNDVLIYKISSGALYKIPALSNLYNAYYYNAYIYYDDPENNAIMRYSIESGQTDKVVKPESDISNYVIDNSKVYYTLLGQSGIYTTSLIDGTSAVQLKDKSYDIHFIKGDYIIASDKGNENKRWYIYNQTSTKLISVGPKDWSLINIVNDNILTENTVGKQKHHRMFKLDGEEVPLQNLD
jgi:hypothetical protein